MGLGRLIAAGLAVGGVALVRLCRKSQRRSRALFLKPPASAGAQCPGKDRVEWKFGEEASEEVVPAKVVPPAPALPALPLPDTALNSDLVHPFRDFGCKLRQVLRLDAPWAHLKHCRQVMLSEAGPGISAQLRAQALLAEAAQLAWHACIVVRACRLALCRLPVQFQGKLGRRKLRLLWDLVDYRLSTIQSLQHKLEANPQLARTCVEALCRSFCRSPPAYRPATLSNNFWTQAEQLIFPRHELRLLNSMSAAGKVPALDQLGVRCITFGQLTYGL